MTTYKDNITKSIDEITQELLSYDAFHILRDMLEYRLDENISTIGMIAICIDEDTSKLLTKYLKSPKRFKLSVQELNDLYLTICDVEELCTPESSVQYIRTNYRKAIEFLKRCSTYISPKSMFGLCI